MNKEESRRYHKHLAPDAERKPNFTAKGKDTDEVLGWMKQKEEEARRTRKVFRIKIGRCLIETTNPAKWSEYIKEREAVYDKCKFCANEWC